MSRNEYIPAYRVVRSLSRSLHCEPEWIWDVLDVSFNICKGEGCQMTRSEAAELRMALKELMNG